MEAAGHTCVGFCEIDKFAVASCKAIHDTKGELEYGDITQVSDSEWRKLRGAVDIICGGFPCQSFSLAGHRRGFADTRGTLFFQLARAAEQIQPRLLLLENVKGLLSHDKGKTFAIILRTLSALGYDVEWCVLNSKAYVPQNRERVFIIGHLRGAGTRQVFPIGDAEQAADLRRIRKVGNVARNQISQTGDVYRTDGLAPTLCASHVRDPLKVVLPILTPDRKKRQNGRRMKENGEPMFTLTAQDRHGIVVREPLKIKNGAKHTPYLEAENGDNINLQPKARGTVKKGYTSTILTSPDGVVDEWEIRHLTPLECFRLQGFPDWVLLNAATGKRWTNKAAAELDETVGISNYLSALPKQERLTSDSQLYKQAGNSVTVPVIYEIARRLE